MTILIKLLQFVNAPVAIEVIEDGMVILVKLLQLKNAPAPITVTGRLRIEAGISRIAAYPVYFVIVTLLPSTISYSRPAGTDSGACTVVGDGFDLTAAGFNE